MKSRKAESRMRASKKRIYLMFVVVLTVFLVTLEVSVVWDGSRPIKLIVHPTSPREGEVVNIVLKVRNTYASEEPFSLAIHVDGRDRVAADAAISSRSADIYSCYAPSPPIGKAVKIHAIVKDVAHSRVYEELMSVPPVPPEVLSGFSSFSSFSSYFMSYITSMSYYMSFLQTPEAHGFLNAGIAMTLTLIGLLVFMQVTVPARIRRSRAVVDPRAYLPGMRNAKRGLETRSAIIRFLTTRATATVPQISQAVPRCKSTVRRHLKKMEDRGITVKVAAKRPFIWSIRDIVLGLETGSGIIWVLATKGPATVSQISRFLPWCKSTIRRHLNRMERRGITVKVEDKRPFIWNFDRSIFSGVGQQPLEIGRKLLSLRSRYSWLTIALLVIFLSMVLTKIYLILIGIV